jgi:hypothetical protein
LIKLEIMAFESTDQVEEEDSTRTAIEVAALVCRRGATEATQMINGVPRCALSGEGWWG